MTLSPFCAIINIESQKGDFILGRRQGSLNKATLEKLKAKYGVDNNKPKTEQTEEKHKRHRRTKAEMELARQQQEVVKEKPKKSKEFKCKSYSETADEFSERLIRQAKEKGDKNWEFDFRKEYMSGQRIYYVEINNLMKSKELLEVQLTTIYSKFMIAYVEQGEAHHISVDDADRIFFHEQDAKECYKEIKL